MRQPKRRQGGAKAFHLLLDGLNPTDHQRVVRTLNDLPRIAFAAGEKVIHEGLPALGVYLIDYGRISVSQPGDDRRRKIVKVLNDGQILGEESMLGDGVYDYYAETIWPSGVRFMRRRTFQTLVEAHPQVLRNLCAKLAQEAQALHGRILEASFCTCKEKVARVVLDLVQTYGEPDAYGHLGVEWRRRDLADMAGISLEMVSRTLNDFERRGWTRLNGELITVLLPDSLWHHACRPGVRPRESLI